MCTGKTRKPEIQKPKLFPLLKKYSHTIFSFLFFFFDRPDQNNMTFQHDYCVLFLIVPKK